MPDYKTPARIAALRLIRDNFPAMLQQEQAGKFPWKQTQVQDIAQAMRFLCFQIAGKNPSWDLEEACDDARTTIAQAELAEVARLQTLYAAARPAMSAVSTELAKYGARS